MKDGFDSRGKFAAGNKLARGNPLNRKAQHLRIALFRAVDKGDIEEVVRALVEKAKTGSVPHAKLLFDRLFGKPHQSVEVSGQSTHVGLSFSDLQIAIVQALGDDQSAKSKVAKALRQITHKEESVNGSDP